MKISQIRPSKRWGSALVVTLVVIVLITVVTVGYLTSVMLETKTAGAALDHERAYGIAMIGVHEAMSRVRDALGPWDDPYKNFATDAPEFYWSLSPGRITRWSYDSLKPVANFALFSESEGTSLVNLNRALADGSYPIIGGMNNGETKPPGISVKWVNVLRDPTKAGGEENAIIGRYGFWVDDEGAKININTADGTEKYTRNSLGIGSPSEVSLEVLFGGEDGRGASKEIVQIARERSFHSPGEILRATNVKSKAVYSENVFALTSYSRSPDLNVFGQPKMALIPILGGPAHDATDMVINGITLQPVREIYPTPSQLPGYEVVNPVTNKVDTRSWPLAFRAEQGRYTLGRPNAFNLGNWFYTAENYCYVNGQMLANYLAGLNAVGRPVKWPTFPGILPAGGFLDDNRPGKYTRRQIDSIVAQIVSLGSKAISADYPYPSSGDYPANKVKLSTDDGLIDGVLEQEGCRYNVSPFIFPGWLSRQWVIGMGRAPKVNSILLEFAAFGSKGEPEDEGYEPPKAYVDIWVEMWLPAGYLGGETVIPDGSTSYFGTLAYDGALNCSDMLYRKSDEPLRYPACLEKPDGRENFWANQVLQNNQGIDFSANPEHRLDPDQNLARDFHDPFCRDPNDATKYVGAAGKLVDFGRDVEHGLASPLRMSFIQGASEWYPGEFRCIRSMYGSKYPLAMQTSANGSDLVISGGIAVRSQIYGGWFSDPDPVPLESIRGKNREGANDMLTDELWSMTVPDGPTVRQRHIASVIPVNVKTLRVPPKNELKGPVRYVYAKTADPLVNKFPGDWKPPHGVNIESDTPPPKSVISMRWETSAPDKGSKLGYSTYSEMDTGWRSTLTDPDSYWMPQADCALSLKKDLAKQTLIPRSARFPSIGYLQYVRTGIMPDDESIPYEDQHGTPFRLLSYAPSTDTANQRTTLGSSQAYPDWAMLDLLYVPSTLIPFGSSYQDSTNLDYFGTFGGATSGRVNPNGTVIYTTDVDVPLEGVTRTLPIQAVFQGVKVNQSITTLPANDPQVLDTHSNLGFSGGSDVDAFKVANAVADYIRENGPLRMPAEISNIPDIAQLRAQKNPTRNDLVRQIVGTLSTQGNVFSVWTVGQVIQKKKGNTSHGEFETGDSVLAEVRLRFVVERYLDPGADGIYGNSGKPGVDHVVGSYDDPRDDTNHPFQPRYLYRVVSSEEVR